jgi:hypothetical protein
MEAILGLQKLELHAGEAMINARSTLSVWCHGTNNSAISIYC